MKRPLAIDLFCGLGGWSESLIAEGWDVVGFDIERHEYSGEKYPGQLVIQDVRTLRGAQFRDAHLIVASPPCQTYSHMAMPFRVGRYKARAYRANPESIAQLNELFDTCFRIQREASEAAGRHIPMIVENVKGAQPWVGRAKWHYGSFYLWGDVPALMPIAFGSKVPNFRFDGSGRSFQSAAVKDGIKGAGQNWSNHAKTGEVSPHWNMQVGNGVKQPGRSGSWFNQGAAFTSRSKRRKAASARIAKIPPPLATHIAKVFKPQ